MTTADQSIHVSVCARTHRGLRREENQDSLLVADLGDAPRSNYAAGAGGGVESFGPMRFALGPCGAILLVADGMGGRAGGALASSIAVSVARDSMGMVGDGHAGAPSPTDFARALRETLLRANQVIRDTVGEDQALQGMGTTATLAGLLGDSVYVAQVGDSRAYLVRDGQIARLTRDQSLVQDLIDAGMIEEGDEGRARDGMLLQALGGADSVRPEVTWHELRAGDVILLCSDGLWQVVPDAELTQLVTSGVDREGLCEQLVDLANARGGPDNITVLAASVDGRLAAPDGSPPIARQRWQMTAE
jgi:protein phosphatase